MKDRQELKSSQQEKASQVQADKLLKLENTLASCYSHLDSEPKKALELAETCRQKAKELQNDKYLGTALCYLARATYHLEGAEKAMPVSREAVTILRAIAPCAALGMAWLNLANCHFRLDDARAADTYRKALEAFESIDDLGGKAAAMLGIGLAYDRMGLYKKAFSAFHQAQDLANKAGQKPVMAAALNNLANLLMDAEDLDVAEQYLHQALKLNEQMARKTGVCHCLANLGKVYRIKGELQRSEHYLRQAMALWQEVGSYSQSLPALQILAQVLKDQGNLEKARELLEECLKRARLTRDNLSIAQTEVELAGILMSSANDSQAESLLLEAVKRFGIKEDTKEYLADACELLVTYYENKQLPAKALLYYKIYTTLQRDLLERERENDLVRLRLHKDYETSELERKLLQQKFDALTKANAKLKQALDKVKTLHGMLPICASCKKIRTDTGYWQQIEAYLSEHSMAIFSHGLCPDCIKKLYKDEDLE